jgi:hypothetical protein
MPYAWKKENNVITVAQISYVCSDCSFVTTSKQEEEKHYSEGHYLASKIGETEAYDEKKHGPVPDWLK